MINAAHPAAAESAGKLAGLWRSRGVDVEAAIEHARGAGHEDPVAHLVELAAAAPWMSWTRPGAGTAKWLTDVVPGLLDGEMALARAQSRQQALPEPRERYAAYLADALARVQRGENPSVAREVLTYELTPDIRSEALAAFDAAVPTVEVIPQPPPAAEFEPVCEPTSYDDRFEDPEFSPDVDLDRYDEPGADEAEPVWEPDSGDDCFEDSEPSPDLDLSRYDEPGGRSTPDRGTQGLPRRQSTIPSVRRRETGKQRLERAVSEYKRLHPAPPKPQPPGRPPPPISRSTPAGKLRARRAAAAAAAAENQGDHPPMGSGRYNAPHGAHSPESGYRTSHVDGDEDQCSASPLSVPVATDDEDGEAW